MGTDVLGNTPSKDSTFETNYDKLERSSRGKENGPKTAETVSGPNPNTLLEVGLMPRIVPEATGNPAEELRRHAVGYLELTRNQGEAFQRNRAYYVALGHKYGLSNQAMGDILGITEGRVRQIVAGI